MRRGSLRNPQKEWIPYLEGLNSGKPLLITYSDAAPGKALLIVFKFCKDS